MEATQDAVKICKQAMVDANDDSCRAMYQAILKDCEKHAQMLQSEMELHKVQKKVGFLGAYFNFNQMKRSRLI